MEYLILTISWLLRTYGAIQEERDPINTPMIWQSSTVKTILMLSWMALLLVSLYMIFSNGGILLLFISIACYFLIAPTLFGKIFKRIIEKSGF